MATRNDHLIMPPEQVTNEIMLQAMFGEDWQRAHVTAFFDDPANIPAERRGICWAGGQWADYHPRMVPGTNQYFTISQFTLADGKAVRRRDQFLRCYVIVADDVKDKIPKKMADLLPPPSWKLETSPGNEQWGWILLIPEGDRDRVDALLDGLVKLGLAPDGTDPGMRGVTRYVRLVEGSNRKAKWMLKVDGCGDQLFPFDCRMVEWHPERLVTLEDLARPFGVDLTVTRSVDKTASTIWPDDSPLSEWLSDTTHCLGEKGGVEGQYHIVCPWVDEHTAGDESGTWVHMLEDGSGEFKCHHGHCQDRGFNDFLEVTGLKKDHDTWAAGWRFAKRMAELNVNGDHIAAGAPVPVGGAAPDAPVPQAAEGPVHYDFVGAGAPVVEIAQARAPAPAWDWEQALHDLPRDLKPQAHIDMMLTFVKAILEIPGAVEKNRAVMAWKDAYRPLLGADGIRDTLAEVRREINEAAALRAGRAVAVEGGGEGEGGGVLVPVDPNRVLDGYCFVKSINRYYHWDEAHSMSPEAFNSALGHLEFHAEALGPQGIPIRLRPSEAFDRRPDKAVAVGLGWLPVDVKTFQMGYQTLCNTYRPPTLQPVAYTMESIKGYLDLVRHICGEHADLVLDHMAFSVQHPEIKIRWQILVFGDARIGKSLMFKPMKRIFEHAHAVIDASAMDAGWGDYFAQKKMVLIEEVYRPEDRHFNNSLKAKLANDDIESLNLKGGAIVRQQNLYSMYLFSNYEDAIHFEEGDNKLLVLEARGHIIPDDEPASAEWYSALGDWLGTADGAGQIYAFLLDRDVSQFPHSKLPVRTAAYMRMCEESLPGHQQVVKHLIDDGAPPFNRKGVTLTQVHHKVKDAGYDKVTIKGVTSTLRKFGFKPYRGEHQIESARRVVRFWSREDLEGLTSGQLLQWYRKNVDQMDPPVPKK